MGSFKRVISSKSSRIMAVMTAIIIALGAALLITSVPASADVYIDQLVTGDKLTQDLSVNGSVIIDNDLDLNGHSLTINGDLIHNSGTLSIGYGNLTVQGSYRSSSADSSYILELCNNNGTTSMTIGGDLTANEYLTIKAPDSSDGEPFWISVGGSLKRNTPYSSTDTYKPMIAENAMVGFQFTGDKIHSVGGNLGYLFIGSSVGTINPTAGDYTMVAASDIQLTGGTVENLSIAKNVNLVSLASLSITGKCAMLGESSLYVNGDLDISQDVQVLMTSDNDSSPKISVTGNLVAPSSQIDLNYIELSVKGDVTLDSESFIPLVENAPSMKIGGGLYITCGDTSSDELRISKLYFNGNTEHVISIYNSPVPTPGATDSSRILTINEFYPSGTVNFSPGTKVNIERCAKITISGNEFSGNVSANSITTTGDLYLSGNITVNYSTFTVNGDLTQSNESSRIYLNGKSTLKVTGDCIINGSIGTDDDQSQARITISGSFEVSENASFDNRNNLINPIKVGGDLIVINNVVSNPTTASAPTYSLPPLYFTGAAEHNITYPSGTSFIGATIEIPELKSDGNVNIASGITTNIDRCTKLVLSGNEFSGSVSADSITTTGDLYLSGNITVNYGTFTVNGDLTQSGENSEINLDGEDSKMIVTGDLRSVNISGNGTLYLNGEYGQSISGSVIVSTLVVSRQPEMYYLANDAVLNPQNYNFRKIDAKNDIEFTVGVWSSQESTWHEITNNTADVSELDGKIPEVIYAKAGPFDLSSRTTSTTNYTSKSGAGTYYIDVSIDSAGTTVQIPLIVTDNGSDNPTPSECDHVYSVTTTLPTCTADGSVIKTCIKCSDVITTTLDSTGHDWGDWEDFTSDTMIRSCSTCGNMQVKSVSQPQEHEHSFTAEITALTCTTSGYTTYTCDCGAHYIDDIVDPAHQYGSEKILNNLKIRTCVICDNIIITDGMTRFTPAPSDD